MRTRAAEDLDQELLDERHSGIPAPGRLGASRNELLAGLLALIIFGAIVVGFWLAATH